MPSLFCQFSKLDKGPTFLSLLNWKRFNFAIVPRAGCISSKVMRRNRGRKRLRETRSPSSSSEDAANNPRQIPRPTQTRSNLKHIWEMNRNLTTAVASLVRWILYPRILPAILRSMRQPHKKKEQNENILCMLDAIRHSNGKTEESVAQLKELFSSQTTYRDRVDKLIAENKVHAEHGLTHND